MGKAGKLAKGAGAMKVAKKNIAKKEKAMSAMALSDQIALKQYQDTIAGITSQLDKRRDLAPRVLHMLTSGMLDSVNKDGEEDRLPGCVNNFRLLSLENLQTLVKVMKGACQHPRCHCEYFYEDQDEN